MKKLLINALIMLVLSMASCQSQKTNPSKKELTKYQFDTIKVIPHTPIAFQNLSGTCWAFAMTSLFESELIRKTGKSIDLSEMYIVRSAYLQKAFAHIMRHGQQPFGEGALNPDALEAISQYGIMPQTVYTGLKKGDKYIDHRQMFKKLQEALPKYTKKGTEQGNWQSEITTILNKNMGIAPDQFNFNNQVFSPKSFMDSSGLKPSDFVHITSFSHKPFYENVVLDLEWNLLNKPFYNVPIDVFLANLDHAIERGFSVAVELDVSEKTYSGDYGIAVIPQNTADSVSILYNPLPEKEITQAFRQQEFENFHTTNDHNQHIVGKVKDQNGKVYYIAKNSWQDWGREGYIFISEAYFKLKVLYFTVHKEGIKVKFSKNE